MFVVTSASNLTFLALFLKLRAYNTYYGSPQRVQSGTIEFYEYDFLLVINCTQGRILHRFRDIAFDMSIVAIFGYPCCILPLTEGFP